MVEKNTLLIRANVEVTGDSLEAIVSHAKKIGRKDTAELVAEMISKFLSEKDFESYVRDRENY